jgi:hypothetical protein
MTDRWFLEYDGETGKWVVWRADPEETVDAAYCTSYDDAKAICDAMNRQEASTMTAEDYKRMASRLQETARKVQAAQQAGEWHYNRELDGSTSWFFNGHARADLDVEEALNAQAARIRTLEAALERIVDKDASEAEAIHECVNRSGFSTCAVDYDWLCHLLPYARSQTHSPRRPRGRLP